MSKTLSLSNAYGSFFVGCGTLAISPYLIPLRSTSPAAAVIICSILTFAVPVLPFLTSITMGIATIAMALAACSMFLTYPFALIADACESDSPRTAMNY